MLNEFFNGSTGETGYTIQRSLRFNSADSSYLSRTPASTGNRRTFTISFWVKRHALAGGTGPGDHSSLFMAGNSTSDTDTFNLIFSATTGGFNVGFLNFGMDTDAVFRDLSAWQHVVCAVDTTQSTLSNRIKLYHNGVDLNLTVNPGVTQNLETAVNNTVPHAIGRNSSSSFYYLNANVADFQLIDGQALVPTDFGEFDDNNVWQPKAYAGSYGTNGFHLDFSDNSSNAALGTDAAGSNDWTVNNLSALSDAYTASSYRENTGAASQTWNNSNAASATSSSLDEDEIFWVDLGSTVSTDLIKFDVTITGTDTNANNYSVYYTTDPASVGSNTYSSFSRSAGGTTGSFTMTLSGSSAISGRYFGIVNGNGGTSATFVYSNFQVYPVTKECDSLLDSPTNYDDGTNVGGNYATLNPLVNSSYASLSDGNLKLSTPSTGRGTSFSTIAVSSGKFYCEIEFDSGSSASARIGVIRSDTDYAETDNFTGETNAIGYLSSGAIVEAGVTLSTQPSTYSTGDIVGIALNMDDGEIEFFKNGVSQGTYNRSILDSGSYYFAVADSSNSAGATFIANFGQRPFAYTPPTGYKSLCTTNLPDPTIADGSTAMDVVTYTGNGGTQSITGLGFNPDLVWIKGRDGDVSHQLYDGARGATKKLSSNTADAEATTSTGLTSFDSTGFSLGSYSSVNNSSDTYVAWTWDAGDSTVSNTDGTITSSVRANPSTGFSIVSYTGNGLTNQTVGHGLNVKPSLVMYKDRDVSSAWRVIPTFINDGQYLELNSTASLVLGSTSFFGSNTSSVLGISGSNSGIINASGNNMIAYCFAPVEGYSAFGSYEGTGGSPVFVYTGFRPAFVLYKNADAAAGWQIYDSTRDPFNQCDARLQANSSGAEDTEAAIDIVSNGFVQRASHARSNASGNTYIYAAFAEHPFKTARAR